MNAAAGQTFAAGRDPQDSVLRRTGGWLRELDRPLRLRDDRGSVAVLMCYIVLLGATLTTFLVDAGTNIQAANKADTYSSEAARSASIAVGPLPTSDSTSRLRAAAAARTYLTQAGVTDFHVTVVGPATVQVSVTDTESTPILGFSVSQTRTHTAQLQIGVTNGQGVH